MNQRLLFRGFLISALLVLFWRGTGAAEYLEGSLYGRITSTGTAGSFVLTEDMVFPQVSLPDRTISAGREVKVSTNVVLSLRLILGEIPDEAISGVARLTIYYLWEGDEILSYAVGTFDLSAGDADNPLKISGPIVGDRYSLYLAARVDSPDPDDAAVIYCRVNPTELVEGGDAPGELLINDEILGRARIAFGNAVLRTVADNFVGSSAMGPAASSVTGLAPGSAVINQVTPPDGSADFTLPGDTAGIEYRSQRAGSGRVNGSGADPLPGSFSLTAHGIYPVGGGRDGEGLSFGRFKLTPDAGGGLEGFVIADAADSVGEVLDGYIFSQVSNGPVRGFLFGGFTAAYDDGNGLTGSVNAVLYEVDSSPPEVGEVDLSDDRKWVSSWFRDLDGWADVKSVYFMINKTRAGGGAYGRYDIRANKLYLFNGATGTWVGGVKPGSWLKPAVPARISTPWVTLDCGRTTVTRAGEYLLIDWKLTLARRMEGSWNIYGKALDNSGQATGWRHIAPTTIDQYP